MATTEDVIILKVGTDQAVKSVGDLKHNIKELKKQLDGYKEATGEVDEQGKKVYKTIEGLTIGSQEYKDALEELKINQNALRDAMYATTASMEEVSASAAGVSESYNSLVHRMAALKEEWRATNDEARRNELGEQIAEINQQLKDMDASVGNYQRNVGNYESGVSGLVAKFDAWGETLKMMPPTLGATKESISKVGETMQLVGKQPILGIIGLLAPIIIKITESLKENETAMDAVKKVMASLQPVFDVLQGVIEAVAQGLAKAVDWFVEFIGQSDGVKNVISSIIGVGNSILQYLLAPIKSAVAGFKGLGNIIKDVFTGNFSDVKKHAKEAGEGIAQAWQEGFSFKDNFQEGKAAGAKFVAGVKSDEIKEAAKEAGKEVAKAFNDGYDEFATDEEAAAYEEAQRAELDAAEAYQRERNDLFWKGQIERLEMAEREKEGMSKAKEEENAILLDLERQRLENKVTENRDDPMAQLRAKIELKKFELDSLHQLEGESNAEFRARQLAAEQEYLDAKRELATEQIALAQNVAAGVSSLLGTIADAYESDTNASEKELKKAKNLRIAGATIDMLSGVVAAISTAMQLGPIAGPIMGAINSATVIAAGVANINKIKSQSTSKNGGGGSVSGASTPAAVNPPSVNTNIPTVRTATSASEEERLNRMASPQKVYILQSDIEAAGSQSKTQVEESSF